MDFPYVGRIVGRAQMDLPEAVSLAALQARQHHGKSDLGQCCRLGLLG